MKHTNPQVEQMTSFIVMDVLERANELQKQGIDIIHLEVGEPDFDVPACVAEAAKAAYDRHLTHYTHSLGDPELRREIAAFYLREYGVTVDPDCIVVTSGSSPSILLALMLLCNPDSEVILSNPGYACYRNFVLATQAKPVLVPLSKEYLQYDIEAIRKCVNPHTAAIFINSPMNPTGMLLDEKFLKDVAALGVPVISDEIYHGLVYEGRAHSILEYTDQAFVLNGFSKRFAMTGLRLGYLIAPKSCMRSLQKLQQNLFICASSIAQQAGIVALRQADPDVERMKQIYDERRRYMISRLREMGFEIKVEPQGAFLHFCQRTQIYYRLLSFCIRCSRKCTCRHHSRYRLWNGRRKICSLLLCEFAGEYQRRTGPYQSVSFSLRLLISSVAASYSSSVTRTDTEGAI